MGDQYDDCKEVSVECPISASAFGYAPNVAGNAILMIVFIFCTLAQIGLAVKYRTISFGIVVGTGCVMEVIGYAGRIMLNKNVWGSGMALQAVMLVVAPSFLAAGIFLTLKHVVITLGRQYSRLQPQGWVWLFVSCDVVAVALQGIGGGLASSADNRALVAAGNNTMIAGVVTGVVTQALCVALFLDFAHNLRKHKQGWLDNNRKAQVSSKTFMFWAVCTSFAFLFIFIRCIYR